MFQIVINNQERPITIKQNSNKQSKEEEEDKI